MVRFEKFKGKTADELKSMTLDQFMPYMNSRSRRALKRASTKSIRFKQLIKKVNRLRAANSTKAIKTHVREAVILPDWLGMTFGVYNGKEFKNVVITIDKIGYRLGDFAHTTGRVLHSGPGVGATRGSKFVPLK
jgi:small subunit ribosomal protein S19